MSSRIPVRVWPAATQNRRGVYSLGKPRLLGLDSRLLPPLDAASSAARAEEVHQLLSCQFGRLAERELAAGWLELSEAARSERIVRRMLARKSQRCRATDRLETGLWQVVAALVSTARAAEIDAIPRKPICRLAAERAGGCPGTPRPARMCRLSV
jgi:hypothetical protein